MVRPAIESYFDGDKYIARIDLPGTDPKDVDIKVASGVLTVKGSREEKRETKKVDYLRREMPYGSSVAITLPEGMKSRTENQSERYNLETLQGTRTANEGLGAACSPLL
jgi:HSP20 family molecular chaperone IbpA